LFFLLSSSEETKRKLIAHIATETAPPSQVVVAMNALAVCSEIDAKRALDRMGPPMDSQNPGHVRAYTMARAINERPRKAKAFIHLLSLL